MRLPAPTVVAVVVAVVAAYRVVTDQMVPVADAVSDQKTFTSTKRTAVVQPVGSRQRTQKRSLCDFYSSVGLALSRLLLWRWEPANAPKRRLFYQSHTLSLFASKSARDRFSLSPPFSLKSICTLST